MYFDAVLLLFFGLILAGIAAYLRFKKHKSMVYLLFFSLFYVYLFKVLDYTLLQFQSLLLLKQFMPNLILNGQADGQATNLVPLVSLTVGDMQTSLLNVLLFVPFGFGLPFITKLRFNQVVAIAALLSVFIELAQLLTGWLAGITFRVADINDLLFNTVGAAVGYILFIGFMHIYCHVLGGHKLPNNPILRYIADRPQGKEELTKVRRPN